MSAIIAQFPQAQTQEVTLDAAILHGMAICAAKDDVRYYLEGVCIECITGNRITLVSTDGAILAAHVTPWVAQGTISAIIPLDVIKGLPKKGNCTLTLYLDNGKPMIDIQTAKGKLSVSAVEGTFPHWRSLVPDSVWEGDIAIANYDPELVSRLFKSFKTVMNTKDNPNFIHRGNNVGVMAWENWLGLIMPMHYGKTRENAIKEINSVITLIK